MRVLVTGGTGEIGRRSITSLLERGHTVHAATRSHENDQLISAAGATPVRLDLLDSEAVKRSAAGFDAIVHLATQIPRSVDFGDESKWTANDRLRAEATGYLVDGAIEHDLATVVIQTYFAVTPPQPDGWIETDPREMLESDDWSRIGVMDSAHAAERHMLRFSNAGGRAVVLRYGSIYSETSEQLQAQVEFLRAGAATIPGSGDNYWPYLSSDDAGTACAAALHIPSGAYHVAEDEPVTLRQFWEAAAAGVGVDAPRAAPAEGPFAPVLLGSWRVSSAPFQRVTGWSPTKSVLEAWPEAAGRYLAGGIGLRPHVQA